MELQPAPWAEEQCGRAALGDVRRPRRVVTTACAMIGNPQASLPEPLPDWADLKAAYRVLDAAEVSHAALLEPHWEHIRAAARQRAVMLLVQDTTEVDFTAHPTPTTQGLGPIGTGAGAGILGQSVLAIEPTRRQVLDLAEQEPFLRQAAPTGEGWAVPSGASGSGSRRCGCGRSRWWARYPLRGAGCTWGTALRICGASSRPARSRAATSW